ncbi:response regulator [Flavobacterium sp. HBTb2-11-1]|uniref:response regulator n=1 Tax=Flavobacterium sp. HBTb2-11-1 TaxID=2692212 RepID=UPI0013694FE0|nr:response regulator [Flavobacterium sp. HBTb2-11-1]MXO06707.1 response regulator [Flavobacterium sp. HBTb2-11-1]
MSKVLIIEDNEHIRENVVEILELSGYEVFDAENGKKGVEIALKNIPDIILCDIMMPELDGYGVLHILQKNAQTQAVPIIFLTAKTERADIRKGMELGVDDYLTKPFDDLELLRAIEARLKKKDAQQLFYGHTSENLKTIISREDGLLKLKEIMLDRNSRKYKKNQYIHCEGDHVGGIYYIISGKVKTVKLTEEGRELITGIYKENDYLDISILFTGNLYLDTAIAMEDTELSFLPLEQLDKLLFLYPDVGTKFIKILSKDMRDKETRLLQIAYMSVRKRIAQGIVHLLQQHSRDGSTIKFSRDDLAAFSGTSPETVSRTLTDFKEEGLIEKTAGTIHILNLEKLSKIRN